MSKDPSSPRPVPATQELVAHARRDPEGRFGELYERVAPAIYSWASLHIRPALRARLDPDDVLQEVTVRAYEAFPRYEEKRGDFRGWVFGIARNVIHGALERLSATQGRPMETQGFGNLPADATAISQRMARDEGTAAFLAWAAGLPEDDRRLLQYRGLEGLEHREVAELLGLSAEAASKRWDRLRERMRALPHIFDFLAA